MTAPARRRQSRRRDRDLAVAPTAPRHADAPGLVVVVDTREQLPYDFAAINVPSVRGKLDAGDYSLLGAESSFACERKELGDLVSTIISDRARFIRELERARTFDFFAIVIEATLEEVLAYRPPASAAVWTRLSEAQIASQPRSVVNSLNTFMVEYGVHVLYASRDRNVCRSLVLRLAERFWRKKHPGHVSPSSSSASPHSSASEASPAS